MSQPEDEQRADEDECPHERDCPEFDGGLRCDLWNYMRRRGSSVPWPSRPEARGKANRGGLRKHVGLVTGMDKIPEGFQLSMQTALSSKRMVWAVLAATGTVIALFPATAWADHAATICGALYPDEGGSDYQECMDPNVLISNAGPCWGRHAHGGSGAGTLWTNIGGLLLDDPDAGYAAEGSWIDGCGGGGNDDSVQGSYGPKDGPGWAGDFDADENFGICRITPRGADTYTYSGENVSPGGQVGPASKNVSVQCAVGSTGGTPVYSASLCAIDCQANQPPGGG